MIDYENKIMEFINNNPNLKAIYEEIQEAIALYNDRQTKATEKRCRKALRLNAFLQSEIISKVSL